MINLIINFLQNRPSVSHYYRELTAVNEDLVDQIRKGNHVSPNKIKSKSICISLYEIQMLCDGIVKQKEKMLAICPDAVNLAEKYNYYN